MRKSIKVAAEICINNFSMASIDQLMNVSYCVQCAAVSPIGILFGGQIGLENRFENQNCRHFRCPISDSGHPYRPLSPVRLRYIHPPHRKWLISSAFQLLRQFVQPSLYSICRDVLERLAIYSCRSTASAAPMPRSSLPNQSCSFFNNWTALAKLDIEFPVAGD